ncbi:uncharacterized protein LOC132047560 [Lycium ferocissimum]|uniref:uncharacterized protein LOC132047560 n=1 Tax=Lycium ferocissimum TaxID=112874 RepID=UPI0028163A25|nr:uncharacterized protein LOC132047560 [Lycium ferocissimum]
MVVVGCTVCLLSLTRSGKILEGGNKNVVDLEPIDEEEEVQPKHPLLLMRILPTRRFFDIPRDCEGRRHSNDVKRALRPLTQLFKSKPPFPQRLIKKKEDAKFHKFYDQLKQLSLNFPLLEAVKEMLDFAKYLKDLLTKKKMVQHETVSLTHTVSFIISTTTVKKKGDLEAFTIPYSVGHHDFACALCDNRVSINLMPLAIYKQSGLGMPRPTTMRLQMADRSIKKPVGVVNDVLVRVGEFMLPANFVILDCAVVRDIPIILGRPFLATEKTLMDSEKNEIKFRVNDEEVTFQASNGMKLPSAYESISMEEESAGKALAGILVNIDAEDMEGYVETVNSLVGITPPRKPSIIEPPKLELKQLPSHLKYEFLGPNNTLLVIVSALLTEEQISLLLKVLREYRRAIGWTIADI